MSRLRAEGAFRGRQRALEQGSLSLDILAGPRELSTGPLS